MLRFLYIIKNVNIIYQNETGTWGIFFWWLYIEYETVILLFLDPLETEL